MAKEKTEQRIKKALGRDDKPKGKTHVHGMHIRRAASGGFIARHELADEAGNPAGEGGAPPEHILPDADAMHAHLDDHMGDQPAAGDMAGAAAPPPQAGPDEQQA